MIYCVLNIGDSLSFSSFAHPYQYGGVDLTRIPESFGNNGPRSFVYRKSDGLSTYIGLNLAVAGTRPSDSLAAIGILKTLVSRVVERIYIVMYMHSNQDTSNGNTAAAATASYCALAKDMYGIDSFLTGTVIPRGDGGGNETFRAAYNANPTNPTWRAANRVDGCFDFAGDIIMGNPANLTDPTWWNPDLIHPTQAGQARLAPIYGAAVEAAITALN